MFTCKIRLMTQISFLISHIAYRLNVILIFYCTTTPLLVAGSSDKTQGDLKVAFCCVSSRLRRIGPLAGHYNGCNSKVPLDKQRRVHDNR
jgi:hypothetical protein